MSEELRALADAFDDLLEASLPVEALLESAAADLPVAPGCRSNVSEMGFHAVALTEEDGGFGRRPDWIAALMQVAGRRLLPSILRDEALLLAPLLASAARKGDPDAGGWLPLFQSGDMAGSIRAVITGPDLQRIEADGASFACGGLPVFAPLETGVVGVVTPDGAWLFAGDDPRVNLEPRHSIEPGGGAALLSIAGEGTVAATRHFESEEVADLLRSWQLGVFAEAVGCADSVTERSVAYAEEREQFGRPIAAFQAVAHILADMKQRTELGRSVLARVVSLMERDAVEDVDDLLAAARVWVPKMAREVAENGIQVHGGMGFTWELGLHLWYRRALQIQALMGGEAGAAAAAGEHFTSRAHDAIGA